MYEGFEGTEIPLDNINESLIDQESASRKREWYLVQPIEFYGQDWFLGEDEEIITVFLLFIYQLFITKPFVSHFFRNFSTKAHKLISFVLFLQRELFFWVHFVAFLICLCIKEQNYHSFKA